MNFSRLYFLFAVLFCTQHALGTSTAPSTDRQQLDETTVAPPFRKSPIGKEDAGCCSQRHLPATRALSASTADGLGKFGQRSLGILNSIGEHSIPVIMVEFQDVEFKEEHTELKIDSLFNHPGFKHHRSGRGCVRDYFIQQSYGNFVPNFKIVGKFKAKNKREYYGKNSGSSSGIHTIDLYKEMITTAIAKGVDFQPFVENNHVPLVVLLYAGAGEHNSFETGSENYLWAHFREYSIEANQLRFAGYFIGNELMNTYKKNNGTFEKDSFGNPIVESTHLDGIGVLCHELGHALGLPDAYNTNTGKGYLQTPDFHDIMDYGQYRGNGYRPVGYSAYQRSVLGWLAIEELTDKPGHKILGKLHETGVSPHPKAYIIRNPENRLEYFILENRQESNWFSSNFGHGLLIYHVDYDNNRWYNNTPNNDPNHLRYTVIPADGEWQNNKTATGVDMYKGDFFPGLSQKTDFTSTTVPAMKWYKGMTERPIFGIKEQDGLISFAYIDPNLSNIAHLTNTDAQNKQTIYTLDGRVVSPQNLPPGLYIKGGRKFLVN